jgi:ACS family sodium-dependent inorganic phosphate cotransporter
VFGLGILGTAIMTLFTPILCNLGIGYLIASRVIQGIFSGLAYPSINMVYGQYIPPIERSRTASYGTSGIFVGTILGNFLSGLISEAFGWEWIFYGYGIVAVAWYFLWLYVVKSGPENDNWMSQEEKDFIRESIAEQSGNRAVAIKTPWKAIFTSIPVIAIAISHFSYNWGYYTMLTQLPMYMRDILDFDLTKSGFLSALPYVAQTIIVYIAGFSADFVQKKNILTTTQVRKYFNTGSFVSQTIFLLVAAFISNTAGIVACISMSVGIGALAMSGWLANTLDIAPQFGSIILGISNTLATLPGIVSPILSGYIASTPVSF